MGALLLGSFSQEHVLSPSHTSQPMDILRCFFTKSLRVVPVNSASEMISVCVLEVIWSVAIEVGGEREGVSTFGLRIKEVS